MIKAKLNNGDILFGLSKTNLELLQQGKPIVVNLKDLGLEDKKIIICFGETEDKIFEDLIDFIDLNKTKIHI
jgi:hypothetical protein